MKDIERVRIKRSQRFEAEDPQVARIRGMLNCLLKELVRQTYWVGFGEGSEEARERLARKRKTGFIEDKE